MATQTVDRPMQRNRLMERTRIKRMMHVVSGEPVSEPKPSSSGKSKRPAYLRYIEYV